jgi:MerR family transcriptional regulator, heat shock protein HspR
MTEYYYRKQIIEIFQCDETFLDELEREDLVRSIEVQSYEEPVYTPEQVEKIRIINGLIQELDVNLPGVEVILSMRENMINMQKQFHQILQALVTELKTRMPS